MLIIWLFAVAASAEASPLTVRFIDVGQGDATLVQSGGVTLLIDTGPKGGLDTLESELSECGVERIDYLVLTHPHEDHDANVDYLADRYPIGQLLMPEYADDEEDYGGLLRALTGKGTRIVYPGVGDRIAVGEAMATVVSAPDPGDFASDTNLWSIVLRIDYGENSVIVTGDAEDINEFAMIDAGTCDLDADILRVGHHGSGTSTTGAFVEAVSPDAAVISCGADNSYGHPHNQTLETLWSHGVPVLRTDLNGTIVATLDGEAYAFKYENG